LITTIERLFEYSEQGIVNLNRRYNSDLENRSLHKPPLRFPSRDELMLEVGDKYLASHHPSYGSDVAAYFIWAAFNDQFLNCKLTSVYYEEYIKLYEGELTSGLIDEILIKRLGIPAKMDYFPEKYFFDKFYENVIAIPNLVIIKNDKTSVKATKYSGLVFQLMNVVQLYKRNNDFFKEKIYPKGTIDKDGKAIKPIDSSFIKANYIRIAIANSVRYLAQYQSHLIGNEKEALINYRNLYALFQTLKKSIIFTDDRGIKYILKGSDILKGKLITNGLKKKVIKTIRSVREYDSLIHEDKISFCQWAKKVELKNWRDTNIDEKMVEKALNEIRDIFITKKDTTITSSKILTNDRGEQISGIKDIYKLIDETDFEEYEEYINLVYTTNCPDLESSIFSEEYIQEQIDNYNSSEPIGYL
jgi:hypothetical protein